MHFRNSKINEQQYRPGMSLCTPVSVYTERNRCGLVLPDLAEKPDYQQQASNDDGMT